MIDLLVELAASWGTISDADRGSIQEAEPVHPGGAATQRTSTIEPFHRHFIASGAETPYG